MASDSNTYALIANLVQRPSILTKETACLESVEAGRRLDRRPPENRWRRSVGVKGPHAEKPAFVTLCIRPPPSIVQVSTQIFAV